MASFSELLRERVRDLTRHLATAVKGDLRGVHQGRVASRRLRESLPAAGATAAAARARKSFRQITRALGPVRELDVALAHLEDGLRGARIPRVSVECVRAHVQAERARRREHMLARLERVDLAGAIGRVERIAQSEAGVTARSAQALGRRVRARALGLEMAIDRAGTLYHPDRLHAVRIAGKKLRYVLEVVSSASNLSRGGPSTPPGLVARGGPRAPLRSSASLAAVTGDLRLLKQAQELLGVMHDYQILLEHVSAVSDATPRGAPGAAGLRSMASAYDRECRKLHAAFLKIAPSLAAAASRLRNLDLKVRNTSGNGGALPGAARHSR